MIFSPFVSSSYLLLFTPNRSHGMVSMSLVGGLTRSEQASPDSGVVFAGEFIREMRPHFLACTVSVALS